MSKVYAFPARSPEAPAQPPSALHALLDTLLLVVLALTAAGAAHQAVRHLSGEHDGVAWLACWTGASFCFAALCMRRLAVRRAAHPGVFSPMRLPSRLTTTADLALFFLASNMVLVCLADSLWWSLSLILAAMSSLSAVALAAWNRPALRRPTLALTVATMLWGGLSLASLVWSLPWYWSLARYLVETLLLTVTLTFTWRLRVGQQKPPKLIAGKTSSRLWLRRAS